MALNKKLIVLSGVGLVFAGVGAGVIGYKASQVADGQKQMDDSRASMGGQLSFGLASPLAGFAGTAASDFMAGIGAAAGMAAAQGKDISYVNLSDQIQGDLITGAAHSAKVDNNGSPDANALAATDAGDVQAALKTALMGTFQKAGISVTNFKASDFEIPNLKASDIRKLINDDLSDERIFELYSSSPTYKGGIAKAAATAKQKLVAASKTAAEIQAGVQAAIAKAVKDQYQPTMDAAKAQLKDIVAKISSATVISLNVGIEDIIEAASGGVDFTSLLMNQFGMNPLAGKDAPTLATMMGAMTSGGSEVLESAINAVGNLNGALSAIRRLNPTAHIALMQLSTYDNPAIDKNLELINNAINVAAFTQDIKTGETLVAPVDPRAKLFAGKSLQDIYAADANHVNVSKVFNVMMFTMAVGQDQATKIFTDAGAATIDQQLAAIQAFQADAQAAAAKPSTGAKVNP